jgi:hypothetical protein
MQPRREVSASKSKEMKANLLSFPFISLSESGLFKGLQGIQIKKFASGSTRVPGCAEIASRTRFLAGGLPSFAPSGMILLMGNYS